MRNYSTIRRMVRMSREMRSEASKIKRSNPQGAQDRRRLADEYMTRALVLARRVSPENAM